MKSNRFNIVIFYCKDADFFIGVHGFNIMNALRSIILLNDGHNDILEQVSFPGLIYASVML